MKKARIFTLALATGSLAITSACTDPAYQSRSNTEKGALTGAGVRAALGAVLAGSGNRAKGAALGAIVGAGAGVVAGSILDKQEADLRAATGNNVNITNTGDRLIVTLPQDILFATDSASLRPDLVRDIRAVAQNLNAYPDSRVQVLGHTDNVGDAGYNQTLSYSRAQSVSDVLISEGVAAGRIQSIGRGESQPVSSNLTPEGRQLNRRVEIVILPNAA